MLTAEENERLTRVGPATPAGELLRRYWWPIHFTQEVDAKAPPKAVRLLGEDLVLFRDGQGQLGLVVVHCSHRGTSLEYGRVEEDGIRCPYHGWLYDSAGYCLDQPAEPEDSTYKDRIKLPAYRVQELGGLIFAYLGPEPAPLLPRYDLLCSETGERVVGADREYCNWLQRAENAVDEHHLGVLHASVYPQTAMKKHQVTWEPTWYGSRDTVFVPGVYDEPRVTHFLFPSHSRITLARVNTVPSHNLRLRVPTDDTTTTTFWVNVFPSKPGGLKTEGFDQSVPGVYERVDDGWWRLPSHEQDRAAQESQGAIADRTAEHLASTDQGIVLFRRMLDQSMKAVAEGLDPIGIVRDPAANALISFDARMQNVEALV